MLLALSLAAPASADVFQLTAAVPAGCIMGTPTSNALGDIVAFESSCDLAGTNADGNREIFQIDALATLLQLTDTTGCANANPSSNSVGDVVAFDTDCAFGAANPDGSVEIAIVDSGGVTVLTGGFFCSAFAPSIDAAGSLVAFDSDCDYLATNADINSEIFRVTSAGAVEQLTLDAGGQGCGSFNASSDSTGSIIAFESDCDLTGENPDEISEIFQSTPQGLHQLTTADEDTCLSAQPASNAAGDLVAFESDCDLTKANPDRSVEVFTVSATGDVVQVSDDDGMVSCQSVAPNLAGDANVVAYSSFCDPVGDNPDGSFELFSSFGGRTTQITSAVGCASTSPALSGDGSIAFFVSDCDLVGENADGGDEIFSAGVPMCLPCGAPVSANPPSTPPTASDALFVLRVAVAIGGTCELCVCDVNDDTSITATDALIVLGAAVGQDVELRCPS